MCWSKASNESDWSFFFCLYYLHRVKWGCGWGTGTIRFVLIITISDSLIEKQ